MQYHYSFVYIQLFLYFNPYFLLLLQASLKKIGSYTCDSDFLNKWE
jgi:hypothetical protein